MTIDYLIKSIFILMLIHASNVHAQFTDRNSLKGWTFSPMYLHGKILKHSPKFQPAIEDPSNAFELNISKQTKGKQEWQQLYHYPSLGVAVAFTRLGNDEVLGNAFSFMPNIDIPLILSEKSSLNLRIGCGMAYVTEPFDYNTNPTNNVIASHWNNITSFSASGNWHFADQWTLFGGGSFTHFSTGSVRIPNLGINIPTWNLGLRYQPVPYLKEEFIVHDIPPPTKKILFNIQAGFGFQEAHEPNGPMYHAYLIELSAGKMISRWSKLSIGSMVTYKEAATAFIKNQESYSDHLFLNSCAASGFIKDDFLFGYFGISALLGYNFYSPSPLEYNLYQRIGIPVYLPAFGKAGHNRFSIGVYLTAGDFTADFVSVDAGFQF